MRVVWVLACLLAWTTAGAQTTASAEAEVQARLDAAEALRNRDPALFHATVQQLRSEGVDGTPRQREQLAVLSAHSAFTQGQAAAAIDLARPVAESGSDATQRFRARTFLVNALGIQRNYLEGLRMLQALQRDFGPTSPAEQRIEVLSVASSFYSEIEQFELMRDAAEQGLLLRPSRARECLFRMVLVRARSRLEPEKIDTAALNAARSVCSAESLSLYVSIIDVVEGTWQMGIDPDEGFAHLQAALPRIEATGYPRLIAEAHAALSEAYLEGGDWSSAERAAARAVDLSRDLPASRPMSAARRVLYEVAKARGDARVALQQLEAFLASERVYLDDIRAKEIAFRLGQQEALQQEQSLALLGERNKVLTLQTRVAEQAALTSRIALGAVLLLLAGTGAWAWRVKATQRRYRHLAQTDALTGLHNRLYFQQRGGELITLAKRNGEPVTLLLFDMDHFKQINDRFGHATGDWTLQAVAQVARGHCRSNDVLARVGGEEFALLLPNCALRDALQRAEGLRTAIAAIDSHASGQEFAISASVGVASTEAGPYVLDTLLSQADHQLYVAKAEGRNRVAVSAPDTSAPAA